MQISTMANPERPDYEPSWDRLTDTKEFQRLAQFCEIHYTAYMSSVLIIDDDAVFLETVSEALRVGHRDINIETATTAEQGLRLLAHNKFDAIISDFRMSGLNGIDLLKECTVACPDTPVVLITGYGNSALEQDALNHGAYAVLHKPVDPDVMYSVVTRSILRSRLLQRSYPSDHTPPEIYARELEGQRAQLSARIRQVTERLQNALGTDNSTDNS
jgi:DNA-binding NtrC family response regulator